MSPEPMDVHQVLNELGSIQTAAKKAAWSSIQLILQQGLL